MIKVLVIFESITGDVRYGADKIAEGARSVDETDVRIVAADEVTDTELVEADAIAFGSLKFYGSIGPNLGDVFRRIYSLREHFPYKVGTAFSGSPNQYGGQEHVIEGLYHCMMQTGRMIVIGADPAGLGFVGGIVVGRENEVAKNAARKLGCRLAEVAHIIRRGRDTIELEEKQE